jgi:hypothetical protein
MGGGGSATPTTPPGYTGGSVMDYTAPAYSASMMQPDSGFDWASFGGSLGKGVSQFGQGLDNYKVPNIQTSINYPAALQIPQGESSAPGLIPATGQSDTAAVMEMLRRLLSQSGGGY